MSEAIPKRSVVIAGHRTSVSLEDRFWNHIKRIAKGRNISVNDLLTEIESQAPDKSNLSSQARLAVLSDLEEAAGFLPEMGEEITIPSGRPGRTANKIVLED